LAKCRRQTKKTSKVYCRRSVIDGVLCANSKALSHGSTRKFVETVTPSCGFLLKKVHSRAVTRSFFRTTRNNINFCQIQSYLFCLWRRQSVFQFELGNKRDISFSWPEFYRLTVPNELGILVSKFRISGWLSRDFNRILGWFWQDRPRKEDFL